MVISEKSIRMNISASCLPVTENRGAKRTLRVHEVADGDGVAALRAHDVGVEDGVAVVPNPSVRRAHVLLAKLLDLGLDGNRSLSTERYVSAEVKRRRGRRVSSRKLKLTSCSSRGTLFSFILCTAASVEPSSRAAVTREAFILIRRPSEPSVLERGTGAGQLRPTSSDVSVGWINKAMERYLSKTSRSRIDTSGKKDEATTKTGSPCCVC